MSSDPVSAAYLAALRLLDRRRYTDHQLRTKLTEQEHAPESIDAVLARLTASGLVDDRAYAEAYVRDGQTLRGHGRQRLARDLRRRGIDRDVVELVLDEQYPREDEAAVALDLARRRAPRLAGLPPDQARRRLAGYLERRGLNARAVWAAVDAALSDVEPNGDE
ncbi:MAG: regulatory protein RecX [Armatimonadetes bacterium]|nr:regulatory protein RecX [Armatimonadota bacterium]